MTDTTILSKVVFPDPEDPDILPLYVDVDEWTEVVTTKEPDPRAVRHRRGVIAQEVEASPLRISHRNAGSMISGRRSLEVPKGERVSLGTYFNAFPASYWRRWTSLDGVHLRISTHGTGDVVVYRSNARGVIQTVATSHVQGEQISGFALPFDNFLDGGWYWFDLVSRGKDFGLREADWCAPEGAEPRSEGSLTISITTLNRTAYCLALLASIAADVDTVAGLDEILVVDQGSEAIRDHEQFPVVSAALAGTLRLIEQPNVGGSGGFSRGMLEVVESARADFIMLLDDDVAIDPESIRRAHAFARFTREPTIVGGHMFDMYDKTKLHAYAEKVDLWPFMWGPVTPDRHDFGTLNLRQTEWMHRRFDVDYNGWWMSLIPRTVLEEIGLSLPLFIKWDDAEYSLRAAEHGVRTVSLPGAAVWHVSWVDKDDSRDWQAFYHARNRLVAGLLHSPHDHGGRLPISNLASDVRHLLTLDYATVAVRQLAYESVLAGPDALHSELTTRLAQVRGTRAEYAESTLHKDTAAFEPLPATAYFGESREANGPFPIDRSLRDILKSAVPRHWLRRPRPDAVAHPQSHLPHGTPWWRLPDLDSFLISNAEGSGVTHHVRDRAEFRRLLMSSIRHNLRIRKRWSTLRSEYRSALPRITSVETWRRTLRGGKQAP